MVLRDSRRDKVCLLGLGGDCRVDPREDYLLVQGDTDEGGIEKFRVLCIARRSMEPNGHLGIIEYDLWTDHRRGAVLSI